MADELPPLVTRLTGDITGLADTLVKGKALTQEYKAAVEQGLSGGRQIGEKFGKDLGDGIQDAIPAEFDDNAGERLGRQLAAKWRKSLEDSAPQAESTGEKLGASLGDGMSKGVEPGLKDVDRKVTDSASKTGKDAGDAAAQGMSPLIVGAIAGAATIGGPLLVAGLGAAMVGASAVILKQNKVIAADFQQTGKDAAAMVESAAAPLAGEMHAALGQMDQQISTLRPEFKSLFADTAPDISAVSSGLTGLVGGLLPGLSVATQQGQVIVSDFSKALPQLGANIGQFFTGLVRDATMQGQALNQTIGALGNTVRTAGSLIGSASAATSADLIALTPVIDGLDAALLKVSNPATVGSVIGLFGAMKLDPKISSGLSSASDGLAKIAEKGVESGGMLGKVASAADGASGILGKMAGVVGGPWGLAIGAGIGLISGLTAALSGADDATKAITVDQQTLYDKVKADGSAVGQFTADYVASQAQVSGLADEAKHAGVSLDLLTEAATGNKSAMSQLVAITGQSNQVQRDQQAGASAVLVGQNQLNSSFSTGVQRLNDSMAATNTLTVANQQLLNSVRAQDQQVTDAINKQTALTAAETVLNQTTNIFNATLANNYQQMVAKSQATADNAVAALNLGTQQEVLNASLADAVTQYGMAVDGANGYQSVLTALNGTENQLLGTEAAYTIALAGVTTAVKANGTSLDVTNDKGALNIKTFTGIADSAQKAAVALYQSEVNTKGASVAYNDANDKLAQERDAFVAAADKAGFNKDKVQELANELFSLPKDIPINVDANTAPAANAANSLVRYVDSLRGTITVQAQDGSGVSYNPSWGGGKASYDGGGWSRAADGQPEEAVIHGGEYVLSRDQLAGRQAIDARVLAALRAAMTGVALGGGAGPAGAFAAGGAGGDGGITVIAPIYLDGKQIGRTVTRGTRSQAQQYKVRNSLTGFN